MGVESVLLTKVGAVVVVAGVGRDGRRRGHVPGRLGALEQRRQVGEGLLDRLGLPGRIGRLLLVRLDIRLGELGRLALRLLRNGIEHLEIPLLGR